MHKVALFNGKIIETADALIPAMSAAAMYGRGVFTTIAVYDGEPFLIDKHWPRLGDNAKKLGINIEDSFKQIESWLRQLLEANGEADCRARVTLFDSASASLWTETSVAGTDVLIVTRETREVPTEFRLNVSKFPINSRSPLAGVKSCNYLEHLIAYEDAKRRGFDETIRLNERGEVTSAAMANIFWLRGDQLFTPSLETGCLAGTAREFILDNLDVREVSVRLDELQSARAVFLSSSGIGIRQVQSIDNKQFDPVDHAILHLLPPNTKTRMSAR
jgi:branched-subunit amino acid aminotransferase/4-amino-4-deoxychorismate lyase